MRVRSLVNVSAVILLTACSSTPQSDQAAVSPSPNQSVAQKPQGFPDPVVSPAALLPVPVVPGLITPTNARMRVPTIVTGRTDPFAAIATDPIRLSAASKPAVKLLSPLPPSAQRLPTFAPPLATVPLPLSAAPLPTMSLPALPPSRTSIADAIEITGVVQVGGRWSVIVKEPDASTSRYVRPGDYLANGQVLVKRIVSGVGADPIVILQQDGVEITRLIGGGSDRIASK